MQHFGAPTRLLDWSDGALIGLYFAVRQRAETTIRRSDPDAAVWMLDPVWLNKRSIGLPYVADWDWKEVSPYLLMGDELKPHAAAALDPPHISTRVAVQRSRFTVHGNNPDDLDQLAGNDDSRLLKFTINRSAIPQLKIDLSLLGVDETTIFPDLEGLARQLQWDYGGVPRMQ
jgi:hypothetical protein